MKPNVIIFGTKNFNNTFNEIQEYLNQGRLAKAVTRRAYR